MQVPDSRALEGLLVAVAQQIEKQGLTDPEEISAYVETVGQEIIEGRAAFEFKPETRLEKAQALMYQAWAETDKRKRVRLAKKALKISPDCADAYVLLGEETSNDLEQARELFQKGVEAGERALGPEFFSEYEGEFWDMFEARPYMRALQAVAECEGILTICHVPSSSTAGF